MNKRADFIDPTKAAAAVLQLKESLAALGADGDDQLLLDSIEGETGFFEIVDRLMERRALALANAEGVGRLIDNLKARKDRMEKAAETDKALIEQALLLADINFAIPRPAGTLSLARRAPTLEVLEESDIPTRFWKPGDPKLDKKALAAALKARREAIDAASEITDPAEREAAFAKIAEEHPEIPGAVLSNGSQSLTIRVA